MKKIKSETAYVGEIVDVRTDTFRYALVELDDAIEACHDSKSLIGLLDLRSRLNP